MYAILNPWPWGHFSSYTDWSPCGRLWPDECCQLPASMLPGAWPSRIPPSRRSRRRKGSLLCWACAATASASSWNSQKGSLPYRPAATGACRCSGMSNLCCLDYARQVKHQYAKMPSKVNKIIILSCTRTVCTQYSPLVNTKSILALYTDTVHVDSVYILIWIHPVYSSCCRNLTWRNKKQDTY